MKLIKPYYSIIEPTGYTIEDVYKSIELAGKVSHKSEHTIKEGSAKEFVDRIINWGHNSCLEFGTVYLTIPWNTVDNNLWCEQYAQNSYSRVIDNPTLKCSHITTNYRVILENKWEHSLQWLCDPTENHIKRYCVKFVCSRSISHEFVRHRKFSFMQESQRYCSYGSNKFNNEITFIEPCWDWDKVTRDGFPTFRTVMYEAENTYLYLINKGWKPEQAREVLPNAAKTELYMCGCSDDWEQFFKLRDDKQHAHPQAYELAHPLHEEFINRGYITK